MCLSIDRTALASIWEALRDDIDDSVSWMALADLVRENGSDESFTLESAWGRAMLAREGAMLLAPTREGRSQCSYVEFYSGYAEPGYDGESIALGDWNAAQRWARTVNEAREYTGKDATPEMLGNMLERLGVDLQWSDEWSACHKCGKLVRTQPDCHSWTPSYELTDGELLCLNCYTPSTEDDDEN